jgi:hypothetical protein
MSRKGYRKKLLQRSIEYLDSKGCRTIGLETRPENIYNIRMYLRCGFRPRHLMLIISLPSICRGADGVALEWSKLDESRQEIMAEQFMSICHSVQSGLDYVKMGKLRLFHEQGEIVAFGEEKEPCGFAVLRTVSQRVREQSEDAFVEAMAMR